MKQTQQWFKNLKQWTFRSMLSGVIFTITVMGLGTVLIYAAVLPGFQKIDDDQLLTFNEWKETVEHLFWKKSSAGGIKYEGNIEVGGGIKIGNVTTCSTSNAGTLKYVGTERCLYYCNGVNWIKITCITYSWSNGGRGTCSETTPTVSNWGPCDKTCGEGTQTRTCTPKNGTQTRTVQCKGSDGSVVADNVCAGTKLTSQTCTASCSGIPISQSCNTQACPTNGSCGTVHGTNRTSAPSTTTEKCSAGTASSVSGSGPWTWTCAGSNGGTNASCSASKLTAQCGLNKGECRLGQLTGSIYGDEGTNEWWWQCRGGSQVETCVIPVCTNSNYPALGYNGMNSDNLFYCCPNESAAKTCGDSVNKNGFPNYHYGTAECSSCQGPYSWGPQ